MLHKDNFRSPKFKPLKVLIMVTVFIAIASALSYLVMLLWNNILVEVTNFKPLSFWKAAGLLLLTKILFGGMGGFKNRRKSKKFSAMRDKWMAMDPVERLEAKNRWKSYCKNKKSHTEEE